MHFEWDETKNRQNQRKHGIAFGLAQEVFLDPSESQWKPKMLMAKNDS